MLVGGSGGWPVEARGFDGGIVFTENGLLIDLEEVTKVVGGCDVFTIGFRTFPERLIVDTRETEGAGPLVQVVEPLSSVEERFHWLGRGGPGVGGAGPV